MDLKLSRNMKPRKLTKKNMPVKRCINLASAGVKKSNVGLIFVLTVVLIVGAGVFSKYLILDRFAEVDAARGAVASIQRQIAEDNAAIDAFGELADKYAHYTYTGMTATELSRADRVEVLNMLARVVLARNYVESWNLNENLLTLYISGRTLQELNLVTQTLEKEELVDYCTVSTAATNELDGSIADAFGEVTAQLEIHLKPAELGVHW